MPAYRNTTTSARTFYGVTINPNEVKFVPGFVNCDGIVRVDLLKKFSVTPAEKNDVKKVEKKTEKPEKETKKTYKSSTSSTTRSSRRTRSNSSSTSRKNGGVKQLESKKTEEKKDTENK